jgi:serine phosphatase RsbU (regulator of sigma subunit)
MKIRSQLVLACFLLSVLPLSVIVVYSYESSRRALETAYRREADARTKQMDRRLATIRGDLQQRLAEVSALPMTNGASDRTPDVGNILLTMGDAASLVDSLEIRPVRLATPKVQTIVREEVRHELSANKVTKTNRNAPPDVEEPAAPPEAPAVSAAEEAADAADEADATQAPDAAPRAVPAMPPGVPLPPMLPRFTMSPEQRDAINEISALGAKLGENFQSMPPAQRMEMEARIQILQRSLNASLRASQTQWKQQFDAAQKQREAYFVARQQQRIAAHDELRRAHDAGREAREHPFPFAPRVAPTPAPAAGPQVAAVRPTPALAPADDVVVKTDAEKQPVRVHEHPTSFLFGQKFNFPLRKEGTIVGHISAQVSTPEVVRRVLGARSEDNDEITFALDNANNVYARTPADRKTIDSAGITERVLKNRPLNDVRDWIVVMSRDPQSGLRVGVARPVGDNLEELRKTAGKNFGYGIALIFVAMIGIVPIANHMTRDVNLVTRGAERIAQGDLMTRLPVKSKNEIGQLASAFNRMAQDLSLQQQTIVEQERTRKEQEIQQRLLALEYERKSIDLEDARRFQLSMLPKSVPAHDRYDVAVFTLTAAEVGGDYYDFHVAESVGRTNVGRTLQSDNLDGSLREDNTTSRTGESDLRKPSNDGVMTATIGDATGHGAKAGTMVTVIKALFAGYVPEVTPAQFLRDAAEKVKRMDLGRMAMALLLARFDRERLTVASAGMLPAYVHRARGGKIEEVARGATPLGTLGADYHDVIIDLAPGDTVLFMTDGFPELQNESGQQLGYGAAVEHFAAAANGATADDVIASLASAAKQWNGDRPPNDDVTFVVVRVKAIA